MAVAVLCFLLTLTSIQFSSGGILNNNEMIMMMIEGKVSLSWLKLSIVDLRRMPMPMPCVFFFTHAC